MNPTDRKQLEAWMLTHHGVRQEVLAGKSEKGGRRFRYKGFVVTWYHTGTILLQGPGLGSVRFTKLNCEKCQDKPKIIQALEYVVRQADKRAEKTPWPPAPQGGKALQEIHRRQVEMHGAPVRRPGFDLKD